MIDYFGPRWSAAWKRSVRLSDRRLTWLRWSAAVGAAIGVALLVLCAGLFFAWLGEVRTLCGVTWPLLQGGLSGLLRLAGLTAAVAALTAALRGIALRAAQQEAHSIASRLRRSIHAQSLRHGGSELLGESGEGPAALFTIECDAVRRAAARWFQVFPFSHATLLALLILSANEDLWLALLSAGLLATGAWVSSALDDRARARSEALRDDARRIEGLLLERLQLASTTSALMLTDEPGEPFVDTLDRYESLEARADAALSWPAAWRWLAFGLGGGFLLLMIAATHRVSPGGAVVLAGAAAVAALMIRAMQGWVDVFQRANDAATSVAVFLDREPAFRLASQAQPLPRLSRGIQLQDVTLADRQGRRLLDQLTLNIPAQSITAMVSMDSRTPGLVGGLLSRLYDPAAGAVLFDDVNIRDATLDSSRGQTARAATDMLFTGALVQNITCDDAGVSDADLEQAIRLSGLEPLILKLPQGRDTIIGRFGLPLESLDAFRVVLARALARNPALLIVDEPPNSNHGSDGQDVEQLLLQAAQGRTLLVFPSRTSTLRMAQRVLMLHNGRLAAEGQHVELVQNNGAYRHLVYSRFSQS